MEKSLMSCEGCGAALTTAADGRSISCAYCGRGERILLDPAKVAATLRGDFASLEQCFLHVAAQLERELPQLATVKRSGLFTKKIDAVEVVIGNHTFRMRRAAHQQVAAECVTTVRGIVLKTETLSLDVWIEQVAAALSALATANDAAHNAIRKIATE